jgi:WD40 repeat protein
MDGMATELNPTVMCPGHLCAVMAVVATEDGKGAVTGCRDGSIRLWDTGSGECLRVFEAPRTYAGIERAVQTQNVLIQDAGHTKAIRSLAVSRDGTFLISTSDDATVRLWLVSTGQCIEVAQDRGGIQHAVAILANDCEFVTASEDGSLYRSYFPEMKPARVFSAHPVVRIYQGLISGSNSRFSYHDELTDLAYGNTFDQLSGRFFGHADAVTGVAVSPNQRYVISASRDATVRLWDAETAQCIWIFGGQGADYRFGFTSVAVCRRSVVAVSDCVRVWRLSGKRFRRALWSIAGEKCRSFGTASNILALAPNGRRVVTIPYPENELHVFSAASGRLLRICRGHTAKINCAVISPDGRLLLSGGDDGSMLIWPLK